MIDDQDFNLEAEVDARTEADAGAESPSEAEGVEASPPAPMVLIEYRSRGLSATLGPPALILVAALAIVSYQRQRPIRMLPLPPAPAETGAAKPAADPLIVKVITSPAPPGRVEEAAAPIAGPVRTETGKQSPRIPAREAAEASPFDLDQPQPQPVAAREPPPVEVAAVARPAIGFVPPGERKAVNARPNPPAAHPEPRAPAPTKEEVMEDIIREAEQKEAERQRLERVKPRMGLITLADQVRKAQARRASFHDDLRQILGNPSEDPGKEIRDLCVQYGRDTRPEIERAVDWALSTSHARVSRRAKVKMMRELGLPEPRILDFLAHEMDPLINSRGGPRDKNEVRIQAARLLLKMPVSAVPDAALERPATPPAVSPFAHAVPASVRGPNRPPQ